MPLWGGFKLTILDKGIFRNTSSLTMGVGLPAEWQLSVMGSPSATMRSEGCSRMTGGEWDCECGSSGWRDNRFELPKSSEREERKQLY